MGQQCRSCSFRYLHNGTSNMVHSQRMPIVVKGRRNCWTYFPRWWRLMKEKIIRKIEKACRRPRTSVKGRVCHSSGVSRKREREATPSGDINNFQPVIPNRNTRQDISVWRSFVFVWDKSIASLKLYSKEEITFFNFFFSLHDEFWKI